MTKKQISAVTVATAIAAAHVVGLGLVQGCGTTRGPASLPETAPMPPVVVPETPLRLDPITPDPVPVTPARVNPAVSGMPPRPVDTSVYVVGKGDHLSGIAKKLGVSKGEIMMLNNLKDPNKIRSGQRLIVPGKIAIDAVPVRPAAPSSSPAVSAAGSVGTYVVRSGDSLSAIAQRCGTTTRELRTANGLTGDLIRVGQKLAIPKGGHAATEVAPKREPAPVVESAMPRPVLPVTAPETDADLTGPAVSNTDLAPVPPAVPAVPAVGGRKHNVRAGDTLLSVASQWNVSIVDLKQANDIPDGPLTPGQVLTIPAAD